MADGVNKLVVYYPEFVDEAGALPVPLEEQREAVVNFVTMKNGEKIPNPSPYSSSPVLTWEIVAEYNEPFCKKTKRLPELEAAINICQQTAAHLVLPQLQNMARNDGFSQLMIESKVNFVCLDQPLVTRATLPAVVENFRQMRMMHSARIRRGLEQTMSKLGNPNALKEITKVNKPKTENAIMFALMLAPIIKHYRSKGYSQRKMVQVLNEEGFAAPEGGQWVLSQLQKVLERVDLNELALDTTPYLDAYHEQSLSLEAQVERLNAEGVPAHQGSPWDVPFLNKLLERLQLIREIMAFNRFMVDVFPQISEYIQAGLDDAAIAEKFNETGVQLPERVLWEIKHQQVEISAERAQHWEPSDVAMTRTIALRRKHDIDHFVNQHTLEKAMRLTSDEPSSQDDQEP